jgi:hypothetical protein
VNNPALFTSAAHRLAQLHQLTLTEWWILLVSLVMLPVVAFNLSRKGYRGTRQWLSRWIPQRTETTLAGKQQLQQAENISRLVSIAANHGPYRANCLKKSLVAWWLLERRGIHPEFMIGVNKDADQFNAHAWLEYQGNILIDADDVRQRFVAFDYNKKLKDC